MSAVTALEIAIKHGLGRLTLPVDPQEFIPEQIDANSFVPLAVQVRHALGVSKLPDIHSDPFDRLLVAQALIEEVPLITADPQVRRYPAVTIW